MNRKEISYLMAIIKTAYPHYYQKTSDIEDALALWGEMFMGDEPLLISKAVKSFIKEDTQGFPPSIGQIKDIAKGIKRRESEDTKMMEQQKMISAPPKEVTAEDEARREEVMEKMRNMLKEV